MTSEAFIETVRVARDLGHGIRDLLPPWAHSIADAPYSLVSNISFALTVLRWRENLDDHEVPPKRIWLNGDALKAWFETVKSNRRREMRGEDPDRSQDIEDPVENAAARGLLVG
jgi:hypothetical protein